MGGQEGEKYVKDMNEIVEKLGDNSNALIYAVTDPAVITMSRPGKNGFTNFINGYLPTALIML